jgi:glycosyltransferase involved in cell wall biosynthesis
MKVAVYSPRDLQIDNSGEYVRTALLTKYLTQFVDSVVLYSLDMPLALQGCVEHVPLPNPRPRIVATAYSAFPVLLWALAISPRSRSLARLVSGHAVDIIHAHAHDASSQLLKIKRWLSMPVAFDVHGILCLLQEDLRARLKDPLRVKMSLRAEKNLMLRMDAIITRSGKEKDFVAEHFDVPADCIFVVADGVDVDFLGGSVAEKAQQAFRTRLQAMEERIIFFAGWFKKTSGLLDLVKAFRILTERYDDLLLVLAGDGPLTMEVRALIAEYKLQRSVRLLGRIPREDFRTYQQLASVVVTPEALAAYNELAPPLKFFECLASGRPTVATRIASNAGVVQDSVHAVLVEPGNPEDMARGIAQVLDNPGAEDMGRRGRRLMVDRYSWRESARQAVQVYSEIIARYKRQKMDY